MANLQAQKITRAPLCHLAYVIRADKEDLYAGIVCRKMETN